MEGKLDNATSSTIKDSFSNMTYFNNLFCYHGNN
jgi:hypothetical protein